MNENNPLKIFHPIQVGGLERLGYKYDGGYVVHSPSLNHAVCLVNYGVGYDVEFEKDFYLRTGLPTLAFDPTLEKISPLLLKLKKFQFISFLRHFKNYMAWNFKKKRLSRYHIQFIKEGISDKNLGMYKELSYHLDKYNLRNKNIILKLDVEGAEYPVLNNSEIYKILPNCTQVILEFHDLDKNIENLTTIMNRFALTHSLIHIHANNHDGTFTYMGKTIPKTIEVTFLLSKYLPEKSHTLFRYPIEGLDQPCHKLKKDILLDFFY